MANRFTVEAVFKGVNRITAPVSRMANSVGKATRRMGAGFSRLNARIKSIGRTSTTALGVAGLAGALLLVKGAMGAVITTGADLEQSLVSAAVRFGGIEKGTAAFQALEDKARDVGRTTEFTSNETAKALAGLALSGFEAGESMKLLKPLADLATSGETDLAEATDIATGAMGAFGLRSNDAAEQVKNFLRISDTMAKTSTSTRTTMTSLFETMKLGAQLSKEAGISLETFLTIAGQLGQAGIQGTRAGTSILNMFRELVTPRTTKELKRLGVEFKNLADGTLDVGSLVNDLRDSMAEVTDPKKRLNKLIELFGSRGGRAVAALLSSEIGAYEELKDSLDNAEGSTRRMAAALRETRKTDIKLFKSAVESLTITFSKATDDGIGGFIHGATKLTRAIERFVEANPIVAKLVLGLTALAGIFLVVGGVVAAISAVILFVVGHVAALVVAVGAVGVAFGAWLSTLKPVQEWFDNFFATDIPGKLKEIGKLLLRLTPVGLTLSVAEAGRKFFGGGEEETTAPTNNFVERREFQESKATLTILDQTSRPGSGVLLEQRGLPSAISLIVEDSGNF